MLIGGKHTNPHKWMRNEWFAIAQELGQLAAAIRADKGAGAAGEARGDRLECLSRYAYRKADAWQHGEEDGRIAAKDEFDLIGFNEWLAGVVAKEREGV